MTNQQIVERALVLARNRAVCRVQVRRDHSLSIGLGCRMPHGNQRLRDTYYGEWELGSFYPNWTLIANGHEVASARDGAKSECSLEGIVIANIEGRCLTEITTRGSVVRTTFMDGVAIDFDSSVDPDDEIFHVFCQDSLIIDYRPAMGWAIAK